MKVYQVTCQIILHDENKGSEWLPIETLGIFSSKEAARNYILSVTEDRQGEVILDDHTEPMQQWSYARCLVVKSPNGITAEHTWRIREWEVRS